MILFLEMLHSEQLHSLSVLRDVLVQGDTPDDLAVAALLHDVGKSRYPLRVWQKTFTVLVRAFAFPVYERWKYGDPANLIQRPFVVAVQHPNWSAELVAAAGASEQAIWLIAQHQSDPADWPGHPYLPLLLRLQAADNAN
ncbi:MAG: HD domain-containing protein [Anaerolineaceae bacterium]|nr:HD domain-containing protein [Anaerolineaceae bacterium]